MEKIITIDTTSLSIIIFYMISKIETKEDIKDIINLSISNKFIDKNILKNEIYNAIKNKKLINNFVINSNLSIEKKIMTFTRKRYCNICKKNNTIVNNMYYADTGNFTCYNCYLYVKNQHYVKKTRTIIVNNKTIYEEYYEYI
jgi:hypothetical protein